MRVLIQRVRRASVTVDGKVVGEIGPGLLAFVGIRATDTPDEVLWMAEKIAQLRVFEDSEGKMNLSLEDTGGGLLVVSQFTLYGELRKGNRPNFLAAARPEMAEALYLEFLSIVRLRIGAERVAAGVFQAIMQVELVNEGPVTILLERDHMDNRSSGQDSQK